MSKKFKHLKLSPHWQQYFSKYPDGYTIIENLIDWVSQVDDMVDNQNKMNETVDHYGDRLDEFIGQYDTHLQETLEQTLSDWQDSGFLNIVINEALDTKYHEMDERLTTQLAQTTTEVSKTQRVIRVSQYVNDYDNDSLAIEKAIEDLPSGGKLLFDNINRDYLVGDLTQPFIIDKPCEVTAEKGVIIKLKDQSTLFHEGGRTELFKATRPNMIIHGLTIDGNSRNNYAMEDGKKIHYAESIHDSYPNGIDLISVQFDGAKIKDVIVENNTIIDSPAVGISAVGGLLTDNFTSPNDHLIIDNVIFRNNFVSESQRTAINFSDGVRNSKMINNVGKNNYWTGLRFYKITNNCEMTGNTVFVDNTINPNLWSYENRPAVEVVWRGLRVGHRDRNPGTCHNSIIRNNTVYTTSSVGGLESGIMVERYNKNISITGNDIKGEHIKTAINSETLEKNIVISGNNISNCVRAIHVSGTLVTITNNVIENCETDGLRTSGEMLEARIQQNTILNCGRHAIVSYLGGSKLLNSIVSDNMVSSLSDSAMYIESTNTIYENNKISTVNTHAVHMRDSTNNTISNNSVEGGRLSLISSNDNLVINNKVRNGSGICLNIPSGSTNNIVANNDSRGGTNTIVTGNFEEGFNLT